MNHMILDCKSFNKIFCYTIIFTFGIGIITSSVVNGESSQVTFEWVSSPIPGHIYDVDVIEDYAYVGATGGLLVLDISNRSAPEMVDFIDSPGGTAYVEADDDFAVITNTWNGIQIFNVSKPDTPILLKKLDLFFVSNLILDNGFLIVQTSPTIEWETCTIQIFELNNLSNNAIVWEFNSPVGYKMPIAIDGEHLFIFDNKSVDSSDQYKFIVVDISQPANPEILGSLLYYDVPREMVVTEGFAHMIDSDASYHIIDVNDPTTPKNIGHYQGSLYLHNPLNLQVYGNYSYVVGYVSGITIMDISDPHEPHFEDFVSLNTDKFRSIIYHEEYIYIPDGSDGLRIIDATEPLDLKEIGGYRLISGPGRIQQLDSNLYILETYRGQQHLLILDPSQRNGDWIINDIPLPNDDSSFLVTGDLCYIYSGDHLQILDISIPNSVIQLSQFPEDDSWYHRSSSEVERIDGPHFSDYSAESDRIALKNNLLLVTTSWEVFLLNVSDPTSPYQVARLPIRGAPHSTTINGNLVFLGYGANITDIIDISSPTDPQLRQTIHFTGEMVGMSVLDGYLYIATNDLEKPEHGHVKLYDINDIDDPKYPLDVSFNGSLQAFEVSGGYTVVSISDYPEYEVLFLDMSSKYNYSEIGRYRVRFNTCDFIINENQLISTSRYSPVSIYNITGPPLASIDLAWPQTAILNTTVEFSGSGFDPDSSIVEYEWVSSIDGWLGIKPKISINNLSLGDHQIFFRVKNEHGEWSNPVKIEVTVEREPETFLETPTDNQNIITLSFIAVGIVGLAIGYHTTSETTRYNLWSYLAPLVIRQRRRRDDDDPLSHHTRGLIQGYLIAHPGAHYALMKRELKLNNGTLAHHLKVLEQAGLVNSHPQGKRRCFFSVKGDSSRYGAFGKGRIGKSMAAWNGEGWSFETIPEGLITTDDKSPTEAQEKIMDLIGKSPGISQTDLAHQVGVTGAGIIYHVDELISRGLIRKERHGMKIAYYLVDSTK